MVHRREINGRPIVLGNQGDLWGNAMTWFDHDTGTVWSQPLGEAILGPLMGQRLELLPSTVVNWGDWRDEHPATVALDAPSQGSGFALDQMAVVVELGPDSIAFPVTDVRQVGVADAIVGDTPVAVTVGSDGDVWTVLSRQLDDRIVDLERDGDVLTEVGGDGRWDATRGVQLEGSGGGLDVLPGFTSFPSDYVTFFPDGFFWRSSGPVPVDQKPGPNIASGRTVMVDDRGLCR